MGMPAALVSDPRSYRVALAQLSSAQKTGAGVPAYLRWVNRPLGRRLAALAYVVGMTPNQVTLLSSLVSAVGIGLIALAAPTIAVAVLAAALMLLGYALDSADGQLARLSGSSGPSGEFLDHLADAIRQPATHLGIAVSLASRSDLSVSWPVVIAIVFATSSSVWFFGQILAESLLPKQAKAPGSAAPAWVSFVKVPYDVAFLYLLLLTLPWAPAFIGCYVALFAFTTCVAVLSLWRKYQALAATRS
jgi:phosphatidylglycerophosphate synthase